MTRVTPPPISVMVIPAEAGIQGEEWVPPVVICLGVPPAAGMSDCYESMSRTPIRDRRPPDAIRGIPSSIRPNRIWQGGIQRGGEGIVARGLSPA